MQNNEPVLYGIPNCDTVKKARTWLGHHGVGHHFHDFKRGGVPADRLPHWLAALGWQALLNRRGTTWHKLDDATKAAVQDEASAVRLMREQPSVIKRPVVDWPDGRVSVGFDEAEWRGRID